MRLTTKGRYGVRAVLNLAANYANRPISIKRIATEEGISPEFLEQIFFKLKKSGIISSVRGPGGGFLLNKKPGEVTIKDILDAVGEPTFPVPCTDPDDPDKCERKSYCHVTETWQQFNEVIEDFLTGLTLKDILDRNGSRFSQKIEQGQNFAI